METYNEKVKLSKCYDTFQEGILDILEIPMVSKAFNQHITELNNVTNGNIETMQEVVTFAKWFFASLLDNTGKFDLKLKCQFDIFRLDNSDFCISWFPRPEYKDVFFRFETKGYIDRQAIEDSFLAKGWRVK
jgi:hypothetical protein